MSASARKWLARLQVRGAAAKLVLSVLADAADKAGRCNLSQAVIAQRAGLGERTVRDALNAAATSGLIRREHRSAGGKTGRIADLIHLAMADVAVVQPANSAGNEAGATGNSCRLRSVVQPAESAVAPFSEPDPKNATESTSRVRVDVYTTSPGEIQPRTSGRVWHEKRLGTWRARVRLDSVDLDLGRHPTEAEATRALEGALADITHAAAHPAGEPRQPHKNHSVLDVAELGAALPDTFSPAWRERYSGPIIMPWDRASRAVHAAPSIDPADDMDRPNAYRLAKEGE